MPSLLPVRASFAAAIVFGFLCSGCAGPSGAAAPVKITPGAPNAVSYWNEVATATINMPPSAVGTPEERLPNYAVDLATVQVAVYDAVMAIAGTHRPYAVTTRLPTAGASQEAAAGAAAYGVLRGLFPGRGERYQAAYDTFVGGLPEGDARAKGLAIGGEVAAGVLALRADDGRLTVLPPFVPGTGPGQFRNASPVNRVGPYIRPFVLTSNAQFRAPGPPALDSARWSADLNETRTLGGADSAVRTEDQLQMARFNTEPPPTFWPRNLRRFAMTDRSIAEQARLMALLWVAHADATCACFESKYHYLFWRPFSAIEPIDPAWKPVVPTPNHPEYPAAHACAAGAAVAVLRGYYGTSQVGFDFDSTVTRTTRHYDTVDAFGDEIQLARIAGGMHYRTSTKDGQALGAAVGDWVLTHAFLPR
jgi:hypothetical protein